MTHRETKRLALALLVRGARADILEGRGPLGAPVPERKDDLTEAELDLIRHEAEQIMVVIDRRAARLRSVGQVR